nr:MAG TPA: hypothetical protein [Herelleviridae sp.]
MFRVFCFGVMQLYIHKICRVWIYLLIFRMLGT